MYTEKRSKGQILKSATRTHLREYGTLICSFLVPPLDARDTQSTYSTRESEICLKLMHGTGYTTRFTLAMAFQRLRN